MILACGIIPMIMKKGFVKTQIELIKKRNEEFDKLHKQNDNA